MEKEGKRRDQIKEAVGHRGTKTTGNGEEEWGSYIERRELGVNTCCLFIYSINTY